MSKFKTGEVVKTASGLAALVCDNNNLVYVDGGSASTGVINDCSKALNARALAVAITETATDPQLLEIAKFYLEKGPKEPEYVTFSEVYQSLKNGKHIRSKTWANPDSFIRLSDMDIISYPSGDRVSVIAVLDCMKSDKKDWYVVGK